MGDLTKTRVVLHLFGEIHPAGPVIFSDAEDQDPDVTETVYLPLEVWREMGEPDSVTVTVEPGDRLNP
jgi:hypothetical protein